VKNRSQESPSLYHFVQLLFVILLVPNAPIRFVFFSHVLDIRSCLMAQPMLTSQYLAVGNLILLYVSIYDFPNQFNP